MKYNSPSKLLLIVLGWIFVGLGVIGIFLPLMPTTIFMIIAAWCFARSSEKFYIWLVYHPRFGKTVRDFYEKKGMSLKSKITSIVMMTTAISISAIFFTQKVFVRIILFSIAIGVAIYIASLKTIKSDIPPQGG